MYYGREKSNVSSFIRLMDGNRRGRKNHLPLLLCRESTCFAAFLHICECFWLYRTILPFMSSTYVLGLLRKPATCCQTLIGLTTTLSKSHTGVLPTLPPAATLVAIKRIVERLMQILEVLHIQLQFNSGQIVGPSTALLEELQNEGQLDLQVAFLPFNLFLLSFLLNGPRLSKTHSYARATEATGEL